MQETIALCFTVEDKIDGHKQNLEERKSRESRNCYDMFHQFATIIADAGEYLNIKYLLNCDREHLTNLADKFQFYFPAKDPRKGNGWARMQDHNY